MAKKTRATVSVIINTKNEEKDIKSCIESVRGLADEIIVADMKSTDRTVEIAKKMGARILSVKDYGYVEPARMYAIDKAKGDWVAIVDADEHLTPTLIQELRRIVAENQYDAVEMPKKNMILKRWMQHTAWWPDYLVRFFKKGYVQWPDVIHSAPIIKGRIYTLPAEERFAIVHYNLQTIDEVIEKITRYSRKESDEVVSQFDSIDDLLAYTSKDFLWRFVDKEGYKDGMRGYIMSEMMRLYRLLIFVNYWEKKGYPELKGLKKYADSFIKKADESIEPVVTVPPTFPDMFRKIFKKKTSKKIT